jgi:hypothetical protein
MFVEEAAVNTASQSMSPGVMADISIVVLGESA